MKRPVVWVTTSLTIAIVVTATFLIMTASRGETIPPGSSVVQARTVANGEGHSRHG